ncbi:MAG: CaiB/BaiF CoA-transferase family protein [Pseudomonadota bacterium]
MNALQDITVVSLEQAVAAPLCARRLRLAGARVIKVERPEGDFARSYDTVAAGHSSYFAWLNAGKESLVLDLRTPDDLDYLRTLIGRADVLIQNLKPGALQGLGLDFEALHAAHPGLISMSIAGFNPKGPGASRKAYDLLMQAESGLASITGTPEGPGRVGVSLVDLATGMFAYEAILTALIARGRSGRGAALDVSLFDAVSEWMSVPLLFHTLGDGAPVRVGLAHPGICPYGVFASSEGKQFVLSIQNEREWQRLCGAGLPANSLLEDPRCLDNPTRVAHRSFVDATLSDLFAQSDYATNARRLDAADLAFAPVNSVADLAEHPDLHTHEVRVGGELVHLPIVPGQPVHEVLSVPELGEHSDTIKAWLDKVAS